MKKIYMILAAISLLTLSLNAQDGKLKTATNLRLQPSSKTVKGSMEQPITINELVRGIKGMSSILDNSQSGPSRAPQKINSDEYLVGPYTTNDFSTNGQGFPGVYGGNNQQAYIFTDLARADFADHDGQELVGFRFALAGNSSQTAVLYDFMAWPYGASGYFESANQHTWSIAQLAGAQAVIGDISIQANNGFVGFKSITVYSGSTVITQWNATTNTTNVPTGWTLESGSQFAANTDGSYYMTYGQSGGGLITISSGLFTGYSDVRVVINTAIDAGSSAQNPTITVNGTTQAITNESPTYNDYEWTISASAPIYTELSGGQWHEFYFDEPITFNVTDTVVGMYLGYRYWQWGSNATGEFQYPIAINPNSTGHGTLSYMTKQTGTDYTYDDIAITFPGNYYTYTNIRSITVTSGTTTILSYSYANNGGTFPAGMTYSGTLGLRNDYSNQVSLYSSDGTGVINISGDVLQGYSNVTVTIYTSTSTRNQTAAVAVNGTQRTTTSRNGINMTWTINGTNGPVYYSGWWEESFPGDLAVQLIFKNENKTPMPEITYVVNGDNVVVTATGEGTVTLTIGDETVQGTGSASITLPRNETTYSVTATATAQDGDKEESDPATQVVTVPFLQTATPVITTTTEGETVTITATGAGTVTLTVDGQTVTGEGSASITLPAGVVSRNVTAEATAKEDGKAVSETATLPVTIPAGEGWLVMDGTYNNPDDLLSFLAGGEDIMMIDQFLASTLNNDQPDHYTYVLKETVEGEEMTSSPVTIPVYKTSSTMEGFYTYDQVMSDTDMHLKANVINSEMDYDIVPDRNTLYYNLYRGDKNAPYPVIDIPHRVSQLQKYDEMDDNGIVHYFFTETYPSGIAPKYNHVGNETVERLDTNYVQGQRGDELSYVPVIWTSGLYTAREDGKNNSYGSDIKRETLGGVDVIIAGSKSDQREWGQWTASNDTTYCVYTPVMTITGIPPIEKMDNDGNVSTYYPFMYRAWCTYSKARDFVHNSDGQLTDAGPMQVPFLLATDVNDQVISHIGREWQRGEGRLDWAFGVPLTEDPHNVGFVIRFYYRKAVTNPTENPNGAPTYRLGENGQAEEYYVVETTGDGSSITTAINELFNGPSVVSQTYYNVQGMQSSTPFDGINIVVTRYSDGSTRTSKVVR